jgi:hypothetical protein
MSIRWFLIALAFVSAVGCETIRAGACPPLKQWTPEQQERLYAELDALPGGAITIDVVADYMTLREQVRACQ